MSADRTPADVLFAAVADSAKAFHAFTKAFEDVLATLATELTPLRDSLAELVRDADLEDRRRARARFRTAALSTGAALVPFAISIAYLLTQGATP